MRNADLDDLPAGYAVLETDDIKVLPLTRVSIIHNDVNEVLLRQEASGKT